MHQVAAPEASFQSAKQRVLAMQAAVESAGEDALGEALAAHLTADHHWRGFHPFNELHGPEAVAMAFWYPLRKAFTAMQWRNDILFAGANHMDGGASRWVVTMGHLMGLFDRPWLSIRPTNRLAFLRYCAFHRIEDERIAETAMYFDIPHLMIQAGQSPFPPETGSHLVQPGPKTHDGLITGDAPASEGAATLNLINAMISDIGQWQSGLPLEEELARTWHDDMLWWGPAGIGSIYTISRYARQHSGPFRAGFANRSKTNHIARLAEGHYGGFFGWPNFTATPTGGFMGMPATGKPGEFRVIDIYRRQGDRLAENWVFIDLLHFWKSQGVDILARNAELGSGT